MTNTTLDKPEVGDLVMDYGGTLCHLPIDIGAMKMNALFCPLTSGGLTGYSTAHKRKEIRHGQ